MRILRKTPRQHGPNEPFRHENHPRPITRRELMGAGFLSGPAIVLAPAWLGALLKGQRADAATLDAATIGGQATNECALKVPANGGGTLGTTGPVPFITIDLAGGANLMGSEAIAGMAGSPTNFISTAGFSKLGVPGSMVPTSTAFIDMTLGLPFHSDSAILRGIKSKASATALAKVNGVVIPAISQNDTNSNPLNAMYLIAKAAGQVQVNGSAVPFGQYATLVGTNATTSGGNSAAPAAYVDSKLQPTRIASSADDTALVGSSSGAANQATVDVLQSQARISTGTAVGTAQAPGTFTGSQVGSTSFVQTTVDPGSNTAAAQAADAVLKEQLRCAYVKTAFTAATSAGPDSVNPDKDTLIVGGTAPIFTAADYADGDFKKTAAVMKLVMNGYAGAGTIVLGGFDYHSGNRADGETKNQKAGVVIGAIIAYADAVQTPVMINVISDGSLTSTGSVDGTTAGRGKLGWQGDSQQVAASLILVYSPKGRPVAAINQIGSLNADGTVNATSSPGANAPNLVTQLVTLNWMALNGVNANFATAFPMQGLGAATAQTALTAFTKIT
ncbi:MAG TPA: hypothetical protein VNO35_36225 [Steroidobacteraceae bacterium]|nr:hypothetical protein [Steroidobacteraceae bacterium]